VVVETNERGIKFRYFIELVVVKTKQIVSNISNVILTRQTYGQRSGKAEGGKRRALSIFFHRTKLLYVPNFELMM